MLSFRPASPFISILLLSTGLAAQPPPRDPQAVAVLQQSLAAMGGANLGSIRDTRATAEITVLRNGNSSTASATISTLATKRLRVETDSPEGRSVFVMSGQRAATKAGTEPAKWIPRKSLGDAGIAHLPVLSILSEWNDPGIGLQYLGLENQGNASLHHVRLRRQPEAGLDARDYDSPCDFYLDRQTLVVTKLVFSLHALSNLRQRVPVEVEYSDYRVVSGILVPFHMVYTIRGQRLREYRITSFLVNQGAQEADFELR